MGGEVLSSRAIIGRFYEELDRLMAEESGVVGQLAMFFGSDQKTEEYKWLGQVPVVREWVGGRQAKGLRDFGTSITSKIWEATLEVDIDDLRRDKTGQLNIRIGELADSAMDHIFTLLTTLINTGDSALAYDGQFFFDTDHSEGDSGTLSNDLSAGTFDVATAAAPTAAEMAAVIQEMVQQFYAFKDDQGRAINRKARNFLFQVPVNMWGAAQQAISSNLLNNGVGSLDNPLKGLANRGFNIDVMANPEMTATTKVYAFRTDGRTKPFIHQEEVPVTVEAVAEGSELEFNNRVHHYGVSTVREAGYGLWQHAVMATLS
jgi:phage major head subunit gpT-like protein